MTDFLDLFRRDFLLHHAFAGSVVAGLFCPLIGVYFMLRRMTLMAVALPQVAAAGIALVFLLQGLGLHWTLHPGEAQDRFMALVGSLGASLLSLLVLARLERRGEGSSDTRLGAVFAAAYALSILLVSENPLGKIEMLNMLQGEIVAVSPRDLHLLLGVYGLLGLALALFHPQFLLVSFDRESAIVMGKNALAWDIFLYLVMGTAVGVNVLIVGPMLTLAFLIIPPLAARRLCRRMRGFFALSSLFGGLSGFLGFYVSYHWDWPLGPSNILVASAVLLVVAGAGRWIPSPAR